MTLLGYLLVLTCVICCTAAPASETERPKDSCGIPPRFSDKELLGDWKEEFYLAGKQAQYTCRPGFIRLGAFRFVCTNGQWETLGTIGQCKKKPCGHPGDIEFGTFELTKEESFVFGALVTYSCNEGYQMISRQRTRECTATGWSNYHPQCEVRYCPPVAVNKNVNVLTTSYEEEYSVGQVIRFECTNAGQKLQGASEVFCTSEGEWNAPPPICEDIRCSPPEITHGRVSIDKSSFKDKETLAFSCSSGYKPSTSALLTCTKNGWSPTPICEEIVCYQEIVKNGMVHYNKEMYRDGETVTLTCNEGYQIEHKPDELRACTANGWSPPLNCISKKCSRPIPKNARIDDLSWYNFPMTPGYNSWFYYYCASGFLSTIKDYYGKTYCTKTGWDPEPKCYRKCEVPSANSVNAHIFLRTRSYIYIEGDKLRFQCHSGYTTLDGQTTGEIECLSDGRFSGEKCSKICQTPDMVNGEYITEKKTFDVGAYLLYKCNEGFVSTDNKVESISQCSSDGWQPKPECKAISCKLLQNVHLESEELTSLYGTVVYFQCPENRTLVGSSVIQCFHYGWSSTNPICRDETNEESLPSLDSTRPKESKCFPISSAPPNARVIDPRNEYSNGDNIEIECDPGYQLYGSGKILCKDGKWQSPPSCIEKKRCRSDPPGIINGEISEETLANQYYSGSKVKYICSDGYHIIGSDESKCMDGKWLPAPTCEGNSCGNPPAIINGKAKDSSREYGHRERATYVCSTGYTLSGTEHASCQLGKWTDVPKCIYSSCERPPTIRNAVIKEAQKKHTYLPGERVTYECADGYTMGQNANYITCEDSNWTKGPECKRIGQTCGAPPVVQSGDITEMKAKTYQSGSSVTYKCANYYKLEGKKVITCKDGEWEKEPVCRVPCTVREDDMHQNNIQRKWGADKTQKLYSEHFDNMTFNCKPGHQISDPKLLRIQCLNGVLKYPRCIKEGSCILQQTEMTFNNIRYNKTTEIENGQTIEFECEEGMVSENGLQATCKNKQIKYPKCSAGRSCRPPQIEHAIISSEELSSYESGSSVNIKCEDTFVLSGHTNVKCENGKWDELPQCLKSCTINPSDLLRNHIELFPKESIPEIVEHGTEVKVKCKTHFKRQGSLIASCDDGVMKYPRCFSGGTCRIIQQHLDDNFLDLDEKHENEVFYEEGETVSFKCKIGYRNKSELTGTCTKSGKQPVVYTMTYPTCEKESAV